jgi:BASS family bile acid:Na+ symporter
MFVLNAIAAILAWLGRHGTGAVAISIFVGLAVPPLAALFKPLVGPAIFLMLCLAFLRVDPAALRHYFTRPALAFAATAWIMLAIPVGFGLLLTGLGLKDALPVLFLALVLQAAGPPIISAPAFAALLGLDAALSLTVLILGSALTPFTAPAFAEVFADGVLTLPPLALGSTLLLIMAGSALVAAVTRRLAGTAWVERQTERMDGANVVLLFVFAVAVMEEVGVQLVAGPLFVLAVLALAFAAALGLTALTTLVFLRASLKRAFALGLAAGHRNVAVLVAASGAAMPDLVWLYFGLAQFPVYTLPYLLSPLARRIASKT